MSDYTFTRTLDSPFDAAVARTRDALAAQGFGVLTEIDVAATLRKKLGVELPPYLILGACSPAHAHRALQAEPRIGAMLPCNVVVRDVGAGRTEVSAIDPVASMAAVRNAALGSVASEVQAALRRVVDSL